MKIFIVAGEHSGDQLGGKLMAALKEAAAEPITFAGLGDENMAAEGLRSIFAISEVAVMGPVEIFLQLPSLARRVYQTVDAALDFSPDIVVIIDSPEFTHPIAKRIRKRRPEIPIIDYVSPSVWAWRPGRARKMKQYVDHVMALLPFEPAAIKKLDGPKCTYVGHPLIEKIDWIRSHDGEALKKRLGLDLSKPVLGILPGSRASELKHLMGPFGEALKILDEKFGPFEVIIPAVKPLRREIIERSSDWPIQPYLTSTEADKYAVFKCSQTMLAASGTVTLEMALARAPMVVCYKVGPIVGSIAKSLIDVPSVVLANLILEKKVFPELIQENCTPETISAALQPLMRGDEERKTQIDALAEIESKMQLPNQMTPSQAAAQVVLAYGNNDKLAAA